MDTAIPQKFPFILDRNSSICQMYENDSPESCDNSILQVLELPLRFI